MPDTAQPFLLIGERLNTNREQFRARVFERDKDFIIKEVRRQIQAKVTHLDVCAGGSGPKETEEMTWLLDTILPALDNATGIVLDSASHECLARALFRMQGRPNTIVNGITRDTEGIAAILPLVVQHQSGIVAILGGTTTPPKSIQERISAAEQLHQTLRTVGVPDNRIYFDPQVLPLAYDTEQPAAILESIRQIRHRWPTVHTIAGLSNVSFNVPNRSLLNRTYVAMLMASGIDAVICNPCDKALRETLFAGRALLGQDDFMADYLSQIT